jgi:hypothetical protein
VDDGQVMVPPEFSEARSAVDFSNKFPPNAHFFKALRFNPDELFEWNFLTVFHRQG